MKHSIPQLLKVWPQCPYLCPRHYTIPCKGHPLQGYDTLDCEKFQPPRKGLAKYSHKRWLKRQICTPVHMYKDVHRAEKQLEN